MTLLYAIASCLFRFFYGLVYRNTITFECDVKTIRGAAIIAPNHVSYLDPQLILGAWPGSLNFFASDYLFKNPLFGWVLRNLQAHPILRGKELATLRSALQLLKEGKKVVLFPEGTRSLDGTLKELRDGVAFLALQAKCPIIPCYVHGAYQAWPRSRKFPRLFGVRTRCIFGSPISPFNEKMELRSKRELTEALYKELKRLSDSN
jgi:1-acyl-sn-glycerol-3-phosphate acyltransferase